mmetsp:Transcript_120058/g.350873  ORF Transcript_120058/g.350873 Transcript_120058/m.350873 type:complete len:208 (-) Transcript_120058:79-702(-)
MYSPTRNAPQDRVSLKFARQQAAALGPNSKIKQKLWYRRGTSTPTELPVSISVRRLQSPPSHHLGSSLFDGLGAAVGEALEVVLEESSQLVCGRLELLNRLPILHPGLFGPQELLRHVLNAAPRHHEAKDGHLLPLRVREVRERSVVDGIDELPCVLQAAAVANTVGATNPASVDEVRRSTVHIQLCRKHLRVDKWMPDKERRAEAS